MKLRRALFVAGAAVLAAGMAGAGWLELERDQGYATMRWTIDGQRDPAACAHLGAERVSIRAVDASGDTRATVSASCGVFSETIPLEDGWYRAEVTMLDNAGHPVSSTLDTESFRVFGDGTIVVEALPFPGAPCTARGGCATLALTR